MFVRGFDNGRGLDPLRVFGTDQSFAVESHNHSGTTGNQSVGHTHPFSGTTGNDSPDHTHTTYTGRRDNTEIHDGSYPAGNSNPIAKTAVPTNYQASGASTRHTHTYSGTTGAVSADHTHSIPSYGQTETRPRNVAMNYIIKT
jgi:hypothetical protein